MEKQTLWFHSCVKNKRNKINEQAKQNKQKTDYMNKTVITTGKERRGMGKLGKRSQLYDG